GPVVPVGSGLRRQLARSSKWALRIILIALCFATASGRTSGAPPKDIWAPLPPAGAPTPRRGHVAIWTGREMIIWGGASQGSLLGDGARYNPSTRRWAKMSVDGAPSPRSAPIAGWTGEELLVWGGERRGGPLSDGARYDPSTDTWTPISADGAPSARFAATAAWTGSELLVWGGLGPDGIIFNDGAGYDPRTDTWTPMSQAGAPSRRVWFAWAWTGSELIVWGGHVESPHSARSTADDGAAYDPAADTWRPIASSPMAPTGPISSVWTGDRMFVSGGTKAALYDPESDAWKAASVDTGVESRLPAATTAGGASVAWTGHEVVMWGGPDSPAVPRSYFRDGSRYDPVSDTWAPIPDGGPQPPTSH